MRCVVWLLGNRLPWPATVSCNSGVTLCRVPSPRDARRNPNVRTIELEFVEAAVRAGVMHPNNASCIQRVRGECVVPRL